MSPGEQKSIRIRNFPEELWNEFLGEGKKRGLTAPQILQEALEAWLLKNKKIEDRARHCDGLLKKNKFNKRG
jgi:hypothetical protein